MIASFAYFIFHNNHPVQDLNYISLLMRRYKFNLNVNLHNN